MEIINVNDLAFDLELVGPPQDAKTWLALARSVREAQEWDKALVAASRAFELDGVNLDVLLTYSLILGEYGRFGEQWELLERARKLSPDNPALHRAIGLWHLRAGDYGSGWRHVAIGCEREERVRVFTDFFQSPIPLWKGETLKGKIVAVFDDSWFGLGLGDAIFFTRWIIKLAACAGEQGGKILWCVPPVLETLLRRSLAQYGEVLFITTPGRFSPALLPKGLPYEERFGGLTLLKSSVMLLQVHLGELIIDGFPHLRTDSGQVATWRGRLSGDKSFKVGFSWSGRYTHPRNSLRSIPIDDLLEVLKDIEGVTFYSLHIGGSPSAMHDFTQEFATIDDTAAFAANLDLVISVDTMIAHLAGALNIPTWVLADMNTHYTWCRTGKETPWYPCARVYRQQKFRDWGSVFEEVREDLIKMLTQTSSDSTESPISCR